MLTRRGFLQALGIGAAAAVLPALPETDPELLEPRRKLWAVPSNAPVGSRLERAEYQSPVSISKSHGYTYDTGEAFSLNSARDAQVKALMQRGEALREMQLLYGDMKVVTHRYVKQGEAWMTNGSIYVSAVDGIDGLQASLNRLGTSRS